MYLSWTAIEAAEPVGECPWLPTGAVFAQAGHSGAGRAEVPDFTGRWWSVLAVWDDPASAVAAGEEALGRTGPASYDAWHVTLEAATYRGDAVLSGGATPFAALPPRGKVGGAAVVITLAGFHDDPARTEEFLTRVGHLGHDVEQAPGRLAALVQAPADGAVLTFSAWESLRHAVTWAYHRPEHAATVRRHEEHGLLATTGFLRCAVLDSRGTLAGTDPLAGRTGTPLPTGATP